MTQENKLNLLFKDYFSLYSPSLSKGVALLEMLLADTVKKGELDLLFNLLCEEISPYLQESSSPEEKAEIFRLVLFDKLHFKIEPLTDEKQLSLKNVIRARKTTPMFMGVLYLLLAQNFDTPAFLALSKGRVIVCFSKEYNFPSVYIEIANNCTFTTAGETYGARSGAVFQIFDNKQIIRYLLSNLIYLYTKQKSEDKKQFIQNLLDSCL